MNQSDAQNIVSDNIHTFEATHDELPGLVRVGRAIWAVLVPGPHHGDVGYGGVKVVLDTDVADDEAVADPFGD